MDSQSSESRGDTIPTMFWGHVQARDGSVAMREKDFGIWQDITCASSVNAQNISGWA